MQEHVCLIVPCYNEAVRLDMTRFDAACRTGALWLVFVDDGSADGTGDLIRKHLSDRIHLLVLEKNSGKAEAVRRGILGAEALPFYPEIEWIGFWDADLSTPLTEVRKMLAFRDLTDVPAVALFGSRISRLGSRVRRGPLRQVLGRLLVIVASVVLRTRAYDSQCGAKVFRPAVAAACFREPFLARWLFDLEILLRLGDAPVVEYPLAEWQDVSGSKLSVLPTAFRTIRDLLRLWATYRRT